MAALVSSVYAFGIEPLAPVTASEEEADGGDRGGWPSFNRLLDGNRFSGLDQINTETVGELREVCRVPVDQPGPFSSGIVLVDGRIYVSTAYAVTAVDPVNCDILWKSIYAPEDREVFNSSRGVAYGNGAVFRGTGDGRLLAYDARYGNELWRTTAGDPHNGEFISAAPIYWDGMVFVGLAGGDWGIQGRMMAYDATTGEEIWSFNTVPAPGEFGNDTWAGDSWQLGGGGTWSSYALDEETGELFIPVANPAPDLVPNVRAGDNLYTNSLLVLDASTGSRLWHYQSRPNDSHDYGLTTPPVLITAPNGRKLVIQGSKDGYVYVIDRQTHQLVYRQAIASIRNHVVDPTPEGVEVCPGILGGLGYNSPAYDPVTQSISAGAIDWCSILTRIEPFEYIPGQPYLGGSYEFIGEAEGLFTSFDVADGTIRWQYRSDAPFVAGVTPTAGGVTFTGDLAGTLYAFRSTDGEILFREDTGGAIAGGIITYLVGGRQYLAVTSGNISRATTTPVFGPPSIIIYSLDGAVSGVGPHSVASGVDRIMAARPDIGKGRAVYSSVCAGCHGGSAEGLSGPNLRGIGRRWSQQRTIAFVLQPTPRMPRMHPAIVDDQDVRNVTAYIHSLD